MRKLIKEILIIFCSVLHRDDSPKVVFYHDVGKKYTPMGTDESVFWSHMKILRSTDRVCLDDGFRGVWDARERFKQMGIHPILAIPVGLVGSPNYLTWDEIRILQKDYHFDFQCHGWSHQTLVGPMIPESLIEERTEAWYVRELEKSKAKISEELNKDVEELCFPVGYFNDELIARCKIAGYKRVYASYPGNVCADYIQPRCLVQDIGSITFSAVLAGGMMIFRNRYISAHRR